MIDNDNVSTTKLSKEWSDNNMPTDVLLEETDNEITKDNCGKFELDNGYGAMICCCNEKCGQWYHTSCVDLEDVDTENDETNDIFYCPRCEDRLSKEYFMCPFCDEKIVNRRSLIYQHYAASHFKEKLQSPDKNFICHLCGKNQEISGPSLHTSVSNITYWKMFCLKITTWRAQ